MVSLPEFMDFILVWKTIVVVDKKFRLVNEFWGIHSENEW